MTGSCIVCHAPLEHLNEQCTQPRGGVDFFTYGHYGSTLFDPMDGSVLHISVCDPCLQEAARHGRVVIGSQTHVPPVSSSYKTWVRS